MLKRTYKRLFKRLKVPDNAKENNLKSLLYTRNYINTSVQALRMRHYILVYRGQTLALKHVMNIKHLVFLNVSIKFLLQVTLRKLLT